jgi:uncharacterized RDD family membrane protein YckC
MQQTMGEATYEEVPSLPYAGFGIRLVAGVLDLVVLASVLLIFMTMAGFYLLVQTDWGAESDFTNSEGYTAVGIAALFLLFVPLYFASFWWWLGQTIGQLAVRIAVTDRDGYHLSGWKALVRTVAWPLSILPMGLGLASIFFDDESRALHDMLAGTVVIELP